MNNLEKTLMKWKFKKIAVIYVVFALTAMIACAAVTGYTFRERISFALQYSRVSDRAEKNNLDSLKGDLQKLAGVTADTVDILVLDQDNNVVYSAKNSEFADGVFDLSRADKEKNYLVSDQYPGTVFRYVDNEEFMISSVLNKDLGEYRHEYESDGFYRNDFSKNRVFLLSFIGDHEDAEKIYIISNPTTVNGGMAVLKADACIMMLLFMAYWVLTALWAYKNAYQSKLYPIFWGIVVLFTNLAGIAVYLLYKNVNVTCEGCGASQSRTNIYCTHCGAKIGRTCKACGASLQKNDKFCPHCGAKAE